MPAENESPREFAGRTERTPLSTWDNAEVCISAKGAVSLYLGRSRFPITHYANFWRGLAIGLPDDATCPLMEILEFINSNEDKLAPPPEFGNRGAKPKTETFAISEQDLKTVDKIAGEMLASDDASKRQQGARLMTIRPTAEIGGGKVLYEQLVMAKEAIKNAQSPAPNPANASQSE